MIARHSSASAGPSGSSCGPVAEPLQDILTELRGVLASLDDEQYARKMGPLFAGASIGGHVRHCLDHVRALTEGLGAGAIDYDRRERGTLIESCVAEAERETVRLARLLADIAQQGADDAVHVAVMPTRDGGSIHLASTLARELAFVLSHTIHHNATIRGMVITLGLPTPAMLGYAPSTIAHQAAQRGEGAACAR